MVWTTHRPEKRRTGQSRLVLKLGFTSGLVEFVGISLCRKGLHKFKLTLRGGGGRHTAGFHGNARAGFNSTPRARLHTQDTPPPTSQAFSPLHVLRNPHMATPQLSKMLEKRQVRLRCLQPRSSSSVAFLATAFVRGVGPDTYLVERVAELGQPSHCVDHPQTLHPTCASVHLDACLEAAPAPTPTSPPLPQATSRCQQPGVQRETGFPARARCGALGPWPSGHAGAAGLLCPSRGGLTRRLPSLMRWGPQLPARATKQSAIGHRPRCCGSPNRRKGLCLKGRLRGY